MMTVYDEKVAENTFFCFVMKMNEECARKPKNAALSYSSPQQKKQN